MVGSWLAHGWLMVDSAVAEPGANSDWGEILCVPRTVLSQLVIVTRQISFYVLYGNLQYTGRTVL